VIGAATYAVELRRLARPRVPHFLLVSDPFDAGADLGADPLEALASRIVPVAKRSGANPFPLMITLGMAHNNDIVVPRPGVRAFHACLRQDLAGAWAITAGPIGSTSVQGVRLPSDARVLLQDGARVRLGDHVVLEFLEPAALHGLVRECLAGALPRALRLRTCG
jgi:hypothetical protein